jgi:uncharacterized protein (DUF1800 family)
MPINCAKESIQPYVPSGNNPWNLQKASHLFRRTSFGAPIAKVKDSLSFSPSLIVNKMVDDAKSLPLTKAPLWAKWQLSNYSPIESERNTQISSQILEWTRQWAYDMKSNGLRDRMSWFWHNHFVTKIEKYICPSWMYEYHSLLQKHALGNFKNFVKEMGTSSAMLVFLDGVQNTRFQPNENYARELFELFTLGVDNGYTQQDIVNTARALSGWNGLDVNNLCGTVIFIPAFWDPGVKTIFGKSGNFGYTEVIDLLFAERSVQISEYITRKIYKNLVNPDVNEVVVNQLAKIFRDNNFELAPLMKAMLSSEHFFDEATISTIIPGHVEFFMTFLNEMNYADDDQIITLLAYSGNDFDQQIFNPTDVSGWPGNRSWITSSSLPYRIEGIRNLIGYYYVKNGNSLEELRNLAKSLTAEQSNVQVVSRSIIAYFLPKGLQYEAEYNDALALFKADVPENYFTSGQWNLDWEYAPLQVYLLINYIANLPEFQLR